MKESRRGFVEPTMPPDVTSSLPAPRRDERRLLRRARGGDVHAFETLIAHHDPAMRRLAGSMVGRPPAMDDVLQDAYVRAFRALPRFEGRAGFGTWLHRLVANAAIDELRRIKRRQEASGAALEESASAAGDLATDTVRRLDLAEALAALPADLRVVVLLVDAEGYSYDEVGELVGIPPGTVASRLHRARTLLRPALVDTLEAT